MLSATALNKIARSKNGAVRCNEKDRSTLMIFKKGVVDLSNRLASWSTEEEDCCSWAGIQCDNVTGRVTKLDLHIDHAYNYDTLEEETFLRGEINLSLLQLEFLNYLDLSNNLFDLVSIPPPANFSDLRYLDLSLNYLVMDNLDWLSRLPSLEYLDLSNIYLENETDWLISMASLASLSELRLRSCRLRNVSSSLNFVNFTSLAILDLSYNEFFKSKFPIWLFNLSRRISSVDLSGNQFEGEIPIAFLKLQNLKSLNLNHNRLNGTIPDWESGEGNMLAYLDLSNNLLSGALPDCWGKWKQLAVLYMGSNKLTGEIPASMGTLSNLNRLDLHNNNFFGEFSLDLSKWRDMELINLENNKFSGSLPSTMPVDLFRMNLRSNQFTGNIPLQICNLRSLMILDLAENMLSGVIPRCIYNITAMASRPIHSIPQETINVTAKGQEREYKDDWLKEYDDPNVAEERNEEDDPFLKSLYLGMGLGFAVGFWGVCGSLFFIRAWRHRFFRIYYGVVDQVYVAVALKFKSFE
ncbi:LRR receptor-like kinase [Senna tora]|uniref:LRR receptor-like kinase n=1 Tax=Senna tora TaxID=362788 RepID=A0A834U100_9FABA|nr:LRR receptor-like kinase [Senna tora]